MRTTIVQIAITEELKGKDRLTRDFLIASRTSKIPITNAGSATACTRIREITGLAAGVATAEGIKHHLTIARTAIASFCASVLETSYLAHWRRSDALR